MEIVRLNSAITTKEALDIVRNNPGLRAVQLPESLAKRLSESTKLFFESHGIYIVTKKGGGRPKFRKTEELVKKAKELKKGGKGLTEASRILKIPESTLYVHIWRKLE